jgi:hypothetical protein
MPKPIHRELPARARAADEAPRLPTLVVATANWYSPSGVTVEAYRDVGRRRRRGGGDAAGGAGGVSRPRRHRLRLLLDRVVYRPAGEFREVAHVSSCLRSFASTHAIAFMEPCRGRC